MYAKIINGAVVKYPYTLNDLYADHPNTTFPTNWTDELLALAGMARVVVTGAHAYDPVTHYAVEGTPVYNADKSRWEQSWQIVAKSPEQIEEERKAAVPRVVSMRQGRLAMLSTPFGEGTLLDVIESMLASIPDPVQQRAAKIDWEYAQEIQRDFTLVQQLTAQLGLTERQIDDLFVLAATL